MDEAVIEIRRSDAGFVVAVVPADPHYPDQQFSELSSARGWAGGLRMVTGYRKLDRTDGATSTKQQAR